MENRLRLPTSWTSSRRCPAAFVSREASASCIERTNEKRSSLTACRSRRRRNLLRAAAHTKRQDGAYRAAHCTTTAQHRRRGAQVRSCMSGLTARCMLWLHLKRVDVPFAAFTSVLSSPTLATIRSRSDAVGKGTLLLQEAYLFSSHKYQTLWEPNLKLHCLGLSKIDLPAIYWTYYQFLSALKKISVGLKS